VADDSAGIPLSLTPPGRLLLQLAQIKAKGIASETLIALLKHPLVASSERGPHLIFTRALELKLRRFGPPFPTPHDITKWADEDEKRRPWGAWLAPIMDGERAATLGAHLAQLRITSERLAAGPGAEGSGALWEEATGRAARGVLESLSNLAEDGDAMDAAAFSAFLAQSLARESVRVPGDAHASLSILGTLEARAQGADVVILGGLNDGIWPQAPTPDPWMNRVLRAKAGLLSPERQVGLSAHDFQQAAMAPEVWMTRATKSEDAETVPSRWLNRITTLLGGLGAQGGPEAVTLMHARGEAWLRDAARLDAALRVPPAPRPSPVPPPALRPDTLSVTEILTLIRDPYAIYAKHILRLRELDPLAQNPDARLRGIVLHDVMEAVLEGLPNEPQAALAHVRDRTAAILARKVPWPAARALWQARLLRAAPWFVATEADRASDRQRLFTEISGEISLDALPFTLRGKADRIDIAQSGAARVYDYKTGSPPSPAQQRHFDKQLPLEAAMVER
ncbi:MAG: PD-(D/E)XK nuclease family protein, partial [Pseudomonadota bacterium]